MWHVTHEPFPYNLYTQTVSILILLQQKEGGCAGPCSAIVALVWHNSGIAAGDSHDISSDQPSKSYRKLNITTASIGA